MFQKLYLLQLNPVHQLSPFLVSLPLGRIYISDFLKQVKELLNLEVEPLIHIAPYHRILTKLDVYLLQKMPFFSLIIYAISS